MREKTTPYGHMLVGSHAELYGKAVELLLTEASKRANATIGLPGGVTPHGWYQWMLEQKALDEAALSRLSWLTSDERYVPVDSPESNFGNAERLFLNPLNVPETRHIPWPVNVDPYSASIVFNRRWNERFGEQRCFDLCCLGLGINGQMAGIFKNSPIMALGSRENFSSIEVPEYGWRLTITDQGLRRCGHIIVMVLGADKEEPLREVMETPFDPHAHPSHLLHEVAQHVTWLVDVDAAAGVGQ